MFSLKFDKPHNLLPIIFRDHFDMPHGERLCKKLEKELPKAKKGFIILTDLSDLDYFDSASYDYIKKIMTLCNSLELKPQCPLLK